MGELNCMLNYVNHLD